MDILNGKEPLEYLVNLGEEKAPIVKTDLGLYMKKNLTRLTIPTATTLQVSTLTGLIDYIKSNIDYLPEKLLVHVESPCTVKLYSPLNGDRDREEFIYAKAILPNNVAYDRFLSTEQFNIMLQSAFVENNDSKLLLKYTGLIRDEAVKDTGDDGISQKVTIKTGITTVGEAVVPNPVILAPFRTFPEVAQPESKFIFRMQEGPKAAIFEADGGAWRNEAMDNVKEYLMLSLEGLDNVKVIS